jgi:hypothetical protein
MRRVFWLTPILVSAALLAGCGGTEERLSVGDTAPEFALQDSKGETISLSEYANGRPVLLYFHMAVG